MVNELSRSALRVNLDVLPQRDDASLPAVRVTFPYNTPDFCNRVFELGAFADYIAAWESGAARYSVRHLWVHDDWSVPLGPVRSLAETKSGLDFVAEFDPAISQAGEVLAAIRNGSLDSYSISWTAAEVETLDKYKGERGDFYIQRKCTLYDVAPVNFAGMPNAKIRQLLKVDLTGKALDGNESASEDAATVPIFGGLGRALDGRNRVRQLVARHDGLPASTEPATTTEGKDT